MDQQFAPTTAAPKGVDVSSGLSNLNPNQLLPALAIADLTTTGGRNIGNMQGLSDLTGGPQNRQTAQQSALALNALNSYEQSLNSAGGAKGSGGIFGKYIESKIPFSKQAAFEKQRTAAASQIAQLTNMDPNAVDQLLPDLQTSPGEAAQMMSHLKSIITQSQAQALQPGQVGLPPQQSYGQQPSGGGGLSSLVGAGVSRGFMPAMSSAATDVAGGSGLSGLAGGVVKSLAELAPEALAL